MVDPDIKAQAIKAVVLWTGAGTSAGARYMSQWTHVAEVLAVLAHLVSIAAGMAACVYSVLLIISWRRSQRDKRNKKGPR
jgi:membrane protein DedA with SNARE-associated domain